MKAVDGEHVTVPELRVHPTDLGKVIGRQGRMPKAIRTILGAAGMKMRKQVSLEILEYCLVICRTACPTAAQD